MSQTGRFLSTLVDLEVDGKTVRAIPRDVQFEPVRDFIVHVDFLRLGKGARIAVDVPVHFKDQEVCSRHQGRRRAQHRVAHVGALLLGRNFIPDEITVDCGGLQIGQSIHLSDIKLPEGVTSAVA